jgi:hypothetical protein
MCPLTIKAVDFLGLAKRYTRSGKYISRLIFNSSPGNLALLLRGMLGDVRRQSSDGKFGWSLFSIHWTVAHNITVCQLNPDMKVERTMEQTECESFCANLQKSPSSQTPVHGVEMAYSLRPKMPRTSTYTIKTILCSIICTQKGYC